MILTRLYRFVFGLKTTTTLHGQHHASEWIKKKIHDKQTICSRAVHHQWRKKSEMSSNSSIKVCIVIKQKKKKKSGNHSTPSSEKKYERIKQRKKIAKSIFDVQTFRGVGWLFFFSLSLICLQRTEFVHRALRLMMY